jgi:cell division protein FtsW
MKWITTILILCVAVLTGLGMVMLYSSSMNIDEGKSAVGAHYLISQLVCFCLGFVLCVAAASVDYRRLKKMAPWLLGLSIVLLGLVFAPKVGVGSHGAHRWIAVPGLRHFQPSELAKLALILFLAAYAEREHRHMHEFTKGLLIPGCIIALTLTLIFIEPDRGCTILLAAVSGAMLILAGVRVIFFAPPALAAVAFVVYSILHDPMRMGRIMAWVHPEESKEGVGYQAYQAMIALGSGGIDGLGLGNGRQKLGFVPEHHTDFIFSIIGEELGLIATLIVVLLFIVLLFCGCYIARRSSDMFGALLASGITFMIGLQAFINMGVVTSVLPNKGMPLPFISYGGTNLLLMLVAVGLLLSISRFSVEPHTKAQPRRTSNPFSSSSELTNA